MPSLEDIPIDTLTQIAALQQQLANNPATRGEYLRLIKKVSPNTVIPEIDAAAPIMAELAKEREAREKLEARLQEDDARRRVLAKREATMKAHKLTEDQMVEVEKIMTDHQIPNYETGAKYYAMERRVAEPTSSSIANPEIALPDSSIWNGGIGNKAALDRIARDQAYKAFNEITGGQ